MTEAILDDLSAANKRIEELEAEVKWVRERGLRAMETAMHHIEQGGCNMDLTIATGACGDLAQEMRGKITGFPVPSYIFAKPCACSLCRWRAEGVESGAP